MGKLGELALKLLWPILQQVVLKLLGVLVDFLIAKCKAFLKTYGERKRQEAQAKKAAAERAAAEAQAGTAPMDAAAIESLRRAADEEVEAAETLAKAMDGLASGLEAAVRDAGEEYKREIRINPLGKGLELKIGEERHLLGPEEPKALPPPQPPLDGGGAKAPA